MAGATPVKSVEGHRDVEGSVVWMDGDGNDVTGTLDAFVLGAAYRSRITLRVRKGSAFDETMVFKYYPDDAVEEQPEDPRLAEERRLTAVLYKRAAAAVIIAEDELDLTRYIPTPVTGGTPVGSFYAKGYGGTVIWTAGEEGEGGLFRADTVYRAEAELYAAAGHEFPETVRITHGGAESVALTAGGVIVTFPATSASVTALTVTDLILEGKVPAPVTGGAPVREFSAAQYTGTAAWAGALSGGLFKAGERYTAVVTLAAVSGYTFTGVRAGAVTHTGGEITVPNEENSGNVTVAFPETGAEATAATVSDRDLTPYIPAPFTGGTPVWSFAGPQYSGAVTWTNVTDGKAHGSGPFLGGKTYRAAVTLTAAPGYTFTGFTGVFTHGGAPSGVSNGDKPAGIGIDFPATEVAAVTDKNLAPYVPRPQAGKAGVTDIDGPQYTGTVAWAPGGAFAEKTAYTATVTLTAKPGWTFTGVAEGSFICNGASSVSNGTGSGTVTITIAFPETPANGAPEIVIEW
jgi:hypothetical protein